ncbi:response regulator [Cutibacterium avidum]|uniref:response regulator n=1 Tax=Cutibacterium avidum TaxID=33010 RepID=UPI0025507578|nr:response regulator transcription factor [Cutibacterium avidum]MDK7360151.1 response regulator transcription factor [Cutibacterium avidum]MDK7373126.1 response regulator transcription factor [Cutibacterium avidum]MDU7484590.1 response regulator transcription factor [Cutibacterium avidum]
MVTVLLADDDPLARSAVSTIVGHDDAITILGQAGDGRDAIRMARELRPDVVLMDLRMPGMDGVTATATLRADPQPPQIVVLTTWDVDNAVMSSINAGASGFLLKSASPQEITTAIKAAAAGDAVLSARSTKQLLDTVRTDPSRRRRRAAAKQLSQLTDRERDIAIEAARGLSNAEIGERLYLAAGTVKSHLANIQAKLDMSNRVQIAVLVERAGLLD